MSQAPSLPTITATAPPPLPSTDAGGPLSAEHLQQLQQAEFRATKVRKAGGVAMFNGVCLAICAGGSALSVLAGPLLGGYDIVAAALTVGLGVVAYNEFKGRRMIRNFHLAGTKLLGFNQLGLLAMLIAYCSWMIGVTYLGPAPYAAEIAAEPMLANALSPFNDMAMKITLAIYGGLMIATVIFQGLNALYYFTRAKHIRAYLQNTPAWVVELQRNSSLPTRP